MKSLTLALLGLACLVSTASADIDPAAQLASVLNQASNDVLAQLAADEETLAKRGIQATCTIKNIAIRREL